MCTQAFRGTGHPAFLVSKKVPATYDDFDFFFPQNSRFWNLKSDFFPEKKSFFQNFQNTANFFYLNFISKKTPKKSENLFSRKKVPATYWVLDFFSQNTPDFGT